MACLVRKTAAVPSHLPWVEKYRPNTIAEVAYQTEVCQALEACINSGSIPHLLLHGPPGTGKTSAILATAKALYGRDALKNRVLELNASDDRGINVVRDKIKKFAQTTLARSNNPRMPCFKMVILDEADCLTSDAQAALRRVIEKYTKVTRFVLICNYVSKVIDPLLSRCMKFRFKPISVDAHLQRLQYIADQEKLRLTAPAFQAIVELADGDLRRSITLLQSCRQLCTVGALSRDDVMEIACAVPEGTIERIYRSCCGTLDEVHTTIEDCVMDGFQADSILLYFYHFITSRDEISEGKKARLAEYLAEADSGLKCGGDERLTLLKAFSKTQLLLQ